MKKVITYGTYDLLHQGHINLLKRAKALGDFLIVGKGTLLIKHAEKLGIASKVKILGARLHDEIFRWLDDIDINFQSSFQKRLCCTIAKAI